MGELAIAAQVLGTVISAVGSMQQGRAQQQAANYEASQLEQNAQQERAASQRQAMEQRRQGRLAQSRGLALAAASGAGASDPGVLDIMGDIDAEGEYRALTALYEGEERARGRQTQANLRRYEGKAAKRAGNMQAMSTVLSSGGKTLYDRFGE